MRKITVTSFDELQSLKEGLQKADAALANAVARGSLSAIQASIKAGGTVFQATEPSARPLLLQAQLHPNGEELVCELLSSLPPLRSVRSLGAGQLSLQFEQGHQVTLEAHDEEEEKALAALANLLTRSLVWTAAYAAKPDEPTSFVRLRDTNAKLVEGAKQGRADQVEAALAEGASVLAVDVDGKPALAWAADQPNHAQLIGAMLANDPSVSVLRHQYLRNQPQARMIKGGTAPLLEPDEVPAGPGHEVSIRNEHLSPNLRAHLHTRDELADEMNALQRFFAARAVPTEIRWPNVVDFQRLLQERFDASLWAVQSNQATEEMTQPTA